MTDVEIRPSAPRATRLCRPGRFARHEEEPIEREFIPPAPEQPPLRSPRMPQIEELPPIAQNQLRAHRGEAPTAPPATETRRRSLLEKLAAFGISRHEDEAPASARRARLRRLSSPRRGRPPPRCTPNTAARSPARRRRGRPRVSSIRTAVRRPAPLRSRTISSKFRLSCVGNPTEQIGELKFRWPRPRRGHFYVTAPALLTNI